MLQGMEFPILILHTSIELVSGGLPKPILNPLHHQNYHQIHVSKKPRGFRDDQLRSGYDRCRMAISTTEGTRTWRNAAAHTAIHQASGSTISWFQVSKADDFTVD